MSYSTRNPIDLIVWRQRRCREQTKKSLTIINDGLQLRQQKNQMQWKLLCQRNKCKEMWQNKKWKEWTRSIEKQKQNIRKKGKDENWSTLSKVICRWINASVDTKQTPAKCPDLYTHSIDYCWHAPTIKNILTELFYFLARYRKEIEIGVDCLVCKCYT